LARPPLASPFQAGHHLNIQGRHSAAFLSTVVFLVPQPAVVGAKLSSTHTHNTALFGKGPNGDTSGTSNPAEENSSDIFDDAKPRTGWNHNLPKEDSSFWQASTDDNNKGSGNSNRGETKQIRTGWLHNTEPTQLAKKINQEQNQQTSKARFRLEQAMKEQQFNHRMITPPAVHACGENRCLAVTEHMISVPLDREKPRSARIDLYFTVVEKVTNDNDVWLQELQSNNNLTPSQRAKDYIAKSGFTSADKMALYLQGGPGFGSPTPMVSLGFSKGASWAASAMDAGYSHIVLMDQRGTGRSTPITKQTLEEKFPDLFLLDRTNGGDNNDSDTKANVDRAVDETTEYMSQFRADNIVLDAEAIKEALMVPPEEPVVDDDPHNPWGLTVGQSFGGFCIMTYLSKIARPPKICILTGGIAPMLTPCFDAYTSLWRRCHERNLRYYEMYPGDIRRVKQIVQHLLNAPPVPLPSGGTLTARRFLQLGIALGGSPSAFATFHAMLSTATTTGDGTIVFTRAFLKYMDSAQSFDDHPIYFWLHESIYGDGPNMNSPTNWAAHRAYESLVEKDVGFDYRHTSALLEDDSQPTLFFGEHVFPYMPEDFAELSGVGLSAVAENLAAKTNWGHLYDADHMRQVLSNGTCKAAAAVYHDDMYVDFDACMKVTARGGPLEKCKVWVTNDYQHSGKQTSALLWVYKVDFRKVSFFRVFNQYKCSTH